MAITPHLSPTSPVKVFSFLYTCPAYASLLPFAPVYAPHSPPPLPFSLLKQLRCHQFLQAGEAGGEMQSVEKLHVVGRGQRAGVPLGLGDGHVLDLGLAGKVRHLLLLRQLIPPLLAAAAAAEGPASACTSVRRPEREEAAAAADTSPA